MTTETTTSSQPPPGRRAGQHVSLLPTLRRLIQDYPAGIGIVKEFLQNADDAGATWLRVTFDERNQPANHLPSPRMRHLLGPALLISSDQVLTDNDLERIQAIGEGSKAQDIQKTGQFGLGFNTAYTVTDYPAFATRDLIRCFDPLEDAVAADGFPGREWNLADLWHFWPDWPRAFGIESGHTDLDYTVFRLPLRTADQARPERLSQTPFAARDVDRVFKEVVDFGSALLIFTSNVLHLELHWIQPNGTARMVVKIRTSNVDTVPGYRAAVKVLDSPDVALEKWSTAPTSCPSTQYGHSFTIETTETRKEFWFVAQGFEPGAGGETIAAARRMLSIGKKAVPRVGAAVSLRPHGDELALTSTRGHLFCSLPLPDASGLPFHINGFFDLNTSRTDPVHGALAGDAAVRVDWNRSLVNAAIPAIVQRLFAALPDKIKERDPLGTYAVWPGKDCLRSQKAWIPEIGTGVARRLSGLPMIRVRQGSSSRWLPTQQARREGTSWPSALTEAIRDDGFELVDPHLPPAVIENLKAVEALPKSCTRSELRGWLTRDLNCGMSDAPLQCLRKAEFIRPLLDFFLSDQVPHLSGLPLAMLEDGRIKTFKENDPALVADAEIRTLFRQWPGWFVHASIDAALSKRLPKGAGIFVVKQQNVLVLARRALGQSTAGAATPWTAGSLGREDLAWLESLVLYLAAHPPDNAATSLQIVPLVPDQTRNLYPLYWPNTPAFPPDNLSPAERAALDAFQVPVVHGSAALTAALFALSKKLPGRPHPSLAQAITHRLLQSAAPASAEQHRVTLLNLLARAHGQKPLPPDVMEGLAHAPIWPVESGGLAAARVDDVFIPSGFSPPPIGQGVALFKTGPGAHWTPLLRDLNAKEFSAAAYVERLFGQLYTMLDSDTQRAALEWLIGSSVIDLLKQESSPMNESALKVLRSAPLVRCTDGQLHPARTLYHPEETAVHSLLGPRVCVPDMAFYGESKESWLQLFKSLQMVSIPRPRDLLKRVFELVDRAQNSGAASVEFDLISIVEHLASRWNTLANQKIGERSLADQLRELAWLPAARGGIFLIEFGVFLEPENRLFRPDELFGRASGSLMASQAPLLAAAGPSVEIMLTALGVQQVIPLSLAVKHFDAVVAAAGESTVSPAAVARTARSFYQLLATSVGTGAAAAPEVNGLRRRPCVWDPESERFRIPSHCFAVPVPFFGSLRAFVAADGAEAEGLRILGWRTTPEVSDFVLFLQDLSARTAGRALTADERERAVYALHRINAQAEPEAEIADLMMLTTDDRLRPAIRVLIDDCPWWRDRLDGAPVALLSETVPPELARRCRVRGAAQVLEEVLVADPVMAEDVETIALCHSFENKVRAPEFKEGLRRLVYQAHKRLEIDVGEALDLHFQPSGPIRTALANSPLAPQQRFGEEDVDIFLSDMRIYVAVGATDVLPLVAEAINRRLGECRLANLAPLEAILQLDPGDIDRILNRRKVPIVPAGAPIPELQWDNPDEDAPVFGVHAAPAVANTNAMGAGMPRPLSLAGSTGGLAVERRPTEVGDPTVGTTDGNIGTGACHPDGIPGGDDPEWRSPFGSGGGARSADPDSLWSPVDTDDGHSGPAEDTPDVLPAVSTSGPRSQPSITPGDGSTLDYGGRRDMRLRTYLTPPTACNGDSEERRRNFALLQNSAIEAARRHEAKRVGTAGAVEIVRAQGYDIVSRDAHGEPNRFIAVRGLDGAWSLRGVALYIDNVATARECGNRFWLYVVENANDPDSAAVCAIANPVERTTEFVLDGGWRLLSEANPETITKPAVGLHLQKDEEHLGVIVAVETVSTGDGQAPLVRLEVLTPTAERKRVPFSPSRHRLTKEP